MTSASAPERHWTAAFAALETERSGEPAWLGAARKAAIARFGELGFPDRRHEEWKYTNPARLARAPWRPAPAAELDAGALDALGLPLGGAPRLVFVNGRLAPALSRVEGLPAGTVAAGAAALRDAAPAPMEALLALPAALADRALAALAVAFAPDTAFVRVPRGVSLEQPLFVVFLTAARAPDPIAAMPRLVVRAESGSRLALVEVHASTGDGEHLTDALGEVSVGANASVAHTRLQLEGAGALHLAHLHARLERDARYASTVVSMGAGLARLDVVGTLEGEGAECGLDGLYLAADGQHVDCRTTVDHQRPHGTSHELYKGVLLGRSRGVFSGKVIVRPDAQKTDARQRNENLLLSRHAEVDSKPQLEIEADDVKCAHGSTIGQLEEDALFYLRARGLDPTAARALLVRGFVAGITAALPGEALRTAVEEALLARIAHPAGEAAA